jgi:O-antigen/teichoic acid export membrane protein
MKKNTVYYAKKLAIGSIAMSLGKSAQKLIGFFILPILTRYLSPEDFGVISVMALIQTGLGLIYNPGVNSASQRLYYDAKNESEKRNIIGSGFLFFLLFPSIVILLGFVSGEYITGKIFKNFQFYPYGIFALLLSFFSQPRRIWAVLLTIKYNVKRISIFTFFAFLISLLSSLILVVVFELGLIGRTIGMLTGPIFLFFVVLKDTLTYTKFAFSYTKLKEILKLGFPLIFAIWSYSILQMSDRFMIERMTNLENLGIYSIAMKIAIIPSMITIGLRQMWTPVFYDNMKNGNYDVIKKLMSIFVWGLSIICGGVILFSNEILVLLVDERYYAAIPIIPWIILGTLFLGLLPLSNSFLGYQKKFKLTSYISLIAAGINIVLNYILINKIGIIGAAIATSISYCLYFLFSIGFTFNDYKKVVDKKSMIVSLIIVSCAMFISYGLYSVSINIVSVTIKLIVTIFVLLISFLLRIINLNDFTMYFRRR